MYSFSLQRSFQSATEVVTQQKFNMILDAFFVSDICNKIRDIKAQLKACTDEAQTKAYEAQIRALKCKLPAFIFQAVWPEGERAKNVSVATGSDLVMLDLDHDPTPAQTFNRIQHKAIAWGLAAAYITPSTEGLKLILRRPPGLDIKDAQKFLSQMLGVAENNDECTHNINRLSFVSPRSYWLYIDYDALFGSKSLIPQEGQFAPANGCQCTPSQTDTACNQVSQTNLYPTEFEGLPYSAIVEALVELNGKPIVHGCRNNFIYKCAVLLAYITDRDPAWIAQILPNFGEAQDKYMATVKSACQSNQSQTLPSMLVTAIEMAKKKCGITGAKDNGPFIDDKEPEMPKKLPKLIRHLISNVPEVCRPMVANGVFPPLATHLSEVEFQLVDGSMKEPGGIMAVCIARQSSGKSAINKPIDYIMADIKAEDDRNRIREQEFKNACNTRGSNKDKPQRPNDLCIRWLTSDMTNAALCRRVEDAGLKYTFASMDELDQLRQLQTPGMKDGKICILIFDQATYGQERVGSQSVTTQVKLRMNFNASSTVEKAVDFFKDRLIDGTLSRINVSTIVNDDTKDFKYGKYDEQYGEVLKPYITNLTLAKGEIKCPKALAMARRLLKECLELAALTDDVIYKEMAYRAVTIAHIKAVILYIANGMKFDKPIDDFCSWSLRYDLWAKRQVFGSYIDEARVQATARHKKRGVSNLLENLKDEFTLKDAEDMRVRLGKDIEGTRSMISLWKFRELITYDSSTDKYSKTDKYKKK